MKKLTGLFLIAALALGVVGCGSSDAEPEGYSESDFSKRPPPEGWGKSGGQAPGQGETAQPQ